MTGRAARLPPAPLVGKNTVKTVLAGLGLSLAVAALPGASRAADPDHENCAAQAASPYEKGFAETGRREEFKGPMKISNLI